MGKNHDDSIFENSKLMVRMMEKINWKVASVKLVQQFNLLQVQRSLHQCLVLFCVDRNDQFLKKKSKKEVRHRDNVL